MGTLLLRTTIYSPAEVCFDLSRSIDLHVHSMKASSEKAIAGRTSGLISKGETVTWRARHFFVNQILTSRITEMQRPHYFRDVMVEGPFLSFEHDHFFEEKGGITTMIDKFRYTPPYGLIGTMVDGLFLKNYLKKLLKHRNMVIKSAAESFEEIVGTNT